MRKHRRHLAGAGVAVLLVAVGAPIAAGADPLEAGTVMVETTDTVVVATDLREGATEAAAQLPLTIEAPVTVEVPRQPTPEEFALFVAYQAAKAEAAADVEASAPAETPAPAPQPDPAPAPAVEPAPVAAVPAGVWDQLAQCESSGNWSINSGNGYSGGLQFLASTWNSQGGQEFAPFAHQASREQQIAVAERLLAATGGSYRASWPGCSRHLGLG